MTRFYQLDLSENMRRPEGGIITGCLIYQRLGYLLAGIPTRDLYALLSKCDDAQRRGFPWSAIFWKATKPNTHDQ